MLNQKAKKALVEMHAKNALADGWKVTRRLGEIKADLLETGAAVKERDELLGVTTIELTEEARRFLHSEACERSAVTMRNRLYE